MNARVQKSLGRVAIVADSAHSLGASRDFGGVRKNCGAIADLTSFSFHAVKNITTAEGGASTWLPMDGIDDSEIYQMFQLLSLHGQSKDAMAKSKPGVWEYDIIRKEMIDMYDKTCDELGIFHLNHHTAKMDSSNHLYLVRFPGADEAKRQEIINKMAQRYVSTNVHYKPLPMMTAYGADCSAYPNSYDYYRNLISLPLHTLLSDEDVEYVCEVLKEAVR